MAYKFQLGAAKLGGAITSSAGIVADGVLSGTSADFNDGNLTNVGIISADKLQSDENATGLTIAASGTDHMILDGSEVLYKKKLKMSGAVALQVRETVFESSADDRFRINVLPAAGEISLEIDGTPEVVIDADGLQASAISLTDASGIAGTNLQDDGAGALRLATSVAGNGLTGGGASALSVQLSGTTGLTVDSDGLYLNSVPNTSLANDSVTVGTTEIDLGASSTTLAGMTGIDFAAGDASIAASLGANILTLGGATSTVKIAGDLDIVGSLNRVTETELLIEDVKIILASGSTSFAIGQGFEIGDGSDALGSMKTATEDFSDGNGNTNIFKVSLPVSSSAFHGDGSGLKNVSATDSILTVDDILDAADENIASAGFHLWAGAQNRTVHLSGSGVDEWIDGEVVYIKNAAASYTLTIAPSGSNTIDGSVQNISLETQGAAVSLVRKGNGWHII